MAMDTNTNTKLAKKEDKYTKVFFILNGLILGEI